MKLLNLFVRLFMFFQISTETEVHLPDMSYRRTNMFY